MGRILPFNSGPVLSKEKSLQMIMRIGFIAPADPLFFRPLLSWLLSHAKVKALPNAKVDLKNWTQ